MPSRFLPWAHAAVTLAGALLELERRLVGRPPFPPDDDYTFFRDRPVWVTGDRYEVRVSGNWLHREVYYLVKHRLPWCRGTPLETLLYRIGWLPMRFHVRCVGETRWRKIACGVPSCLCTCVDL